MNSSGAMGGSEHGNQSCKLRADSNSFGVCRSAADCARQRNGYLSITTSVVDWEVGSGNALNHCVVSVGYH